MATKSPVMTTPPTAASHAPRRRYAKRMRPSNRREQLLDTALAMLARDGLEGLTMQAVATGAGVTKPVVYDNFANIDELSEALLRRVGQQALRSLADVWPFIELHADADPGDLLTDIASGFLRAAQDTDPGELILHAVTTWLRTVAEHPDTWRLILKPPERAPASLRELVDQAHQASITAFVAAIPWLTRRRGIGRDVDPELLGHVVHASLVRAGQLVLDKPERFSPERVAAFAEQIAAAAGIKVPSA